MGNVVVAIGLALAGLAVFGYLTSILWQAVAGPMSGIFSKGRLRRCEDLVDRGDAALQAGELGAALECFARAVYEAPVQSASFAAQVEKHHTGLLSRFIAASDRRRGDNVGVMSLAVVDRALRQRATLQSSYVAALQTGERQRQRKLEKQLRDNGRALRRGFEQLSAEVLALDDAAPQVH